MKELALTENKNLTAVDVQAQVNLIQEVMKQVMVVDVHYGKIPGCGNKPTLLKPGAEKIAMTFKLAPRYEEIAGSVESDAFICYKMNCELTHMPSGKIVGSGRGTCNSKEKKYRTRSAYANKATKAEKEIGELVEGQYPKYIIPQDPWDVQNTILKMACKRALIAAILTATGASDIFTQDIEDLPAGTVSVPEGSKPEVVEPEKADDAKMRKSMISAFDLERGRLGEKAYSATLGKEGFEKVEEITDISEGKRIIKILRALKVPGEDQNDA